MMYYYLIKYKNNHNEVHVVTARNTADLLYRFPREQCLHFCYLSGAVVFYEVQKEADIWRQYLNNGFHLIDKKFM